MIIRAVVGVQSDASSSWRQNMNAEQLANHRKMNRDRQRIRRLNMTEEQRSIVHDSSVIVFGIETPGKS
ncbi:hypothetical protein C5167_038029 [Papaver somniferum]|uniref:Uncharacterized protein n=1 Tax=Papaver somniferum TaxID=3469 RepID=A0A4Y7IBH9_PAPSO|nr:hypothetical protein C5167_038029 [Papaver somniferum]